MTLKIVEDRKVAIIECYFQFLSIRLCRPERPRLKSGAFCTMLGNRD